MYGDVNDVMFVRIKEITTQGLRAAGVPAKLHTIHGLLRGHDFEGQFEARGKSYRFSFLPAEAVLVQKRLVLRGRFMVQAPQSGSRSADNVEARLVATQGGVGGSPVRRQLLTGTAQMAQTATSEQKMEQEKGPETELQPGLHAFDSPRRDDLGRPVIESTGPLAFAGVLYFHLSPLDGRALGVPLNLDRVQLGARLAPTDDTARDLQSLYSDLVAALDGERPDEKAANTYLEKINRILKGESS